ncbi:hypothetical protein D9M69_477770 [compost metagenome]
MRHLQRAHHTRRADRTPADLCLAEFHRLAVGAHEQVFGGARGCGLAAVEGLNALAVPVHDEGAATDAGGLRLDQRQHGLHGDGGIDGRAALAQHGAPGLAGQRIGRGGHMALRIDRRHAGAVAGSDLRGRRQGRSGRRRGRGGRGDDRWRRRCGGRPCPSALRSTRAKQRGRSQGQRAAPHHRIEVKAGHAMSPGEGIRRL